MHIDLNGLPYILNIRWVDGSQDLAAEIVDEAFTFGITRADIQSIDCVVALIERCAGLLPDTETLSEISRYLEEPLQDRHLSAFDSGRHLTSPESQREARHSGAPP